MKLEYVTFYYQNNGVRIIYERALIFNIFFFARAPFPGFASYGCQYLAKSAYKTIGQRMLQLYREIINERFI